MKTLLLLCILLVPATVYAQMTITFQPDSTCGKDAFAWTLLPNNAYPNHPDFIATMWTNNGNPSGTRQFVDFDLAVMPPGVTVQSAVLELYHYPSPNNTGHSNLSGPADCWLQRVTQPWQENTLTWNNQPATTTQNQLNIPAPTSLTQNYSLNVTQLVQDYLNNPSASFGFMLRLQNESYYRSLLFASSDNVNLQLRPKLTVVYTPDVLPAGGCWNVVVEPPDSTGSTLLPDPVVTVPNVFTPNGDQVNDLFFPATDPGVVISAFSIYNRWGNIIYTSTTTFSWNGKTAGDLPCSDGTYYYVITYADTTNQPQVKKGFVTLMR